jgi:hypothetical protein
MSVVTACIKWTVLAWALLFPGLMERAAHAHGFIEEVYVAETRTNDDRAVIIRSSGEIYLIEKGNGCVSLWRYEGNRVLIASPGLFLALGSKLLIPESHQHCSIWRVMRGKMRNDDAWFPMHLRSD